MRKGIVWALCLGLLGCNGTVPVEIPINSLSMMAPELSPPGDVEVSLSILPTRPALTLADDVSDGLGSSDPRLGSAGMGGWQLVGFDILGTAQLDVAVGAGNGLQIGFGTSGFKAAYQFWGSPYGQAGAGSWSAAVSYRNSSYAVRDGENEFLSNTRWRGYSADVDLQSLELTQGYRSSAKSLIYWGLFSQRVDYRGSWRETSSGSVVAQQPFSGNVDLDALKLGTNVTVRPHLTTRVEFAYEFMRSGALRGESPAVGMGVQYHWK